MLNPVSPGCTMKTLVFDEATEQTLYRLVKLLGVQGLPASQTLRRILFVGDTGTGKTSAAHAVASALGAKIIVMPLTDLYGLDVNDTLARMKQAFKELATASPASWENCVLLWEHLDAMGRSRMDSTVWHSDLHRVAAVTAECLDHYASSAVLIAASNQDNVLDKALYNRFDFILEFPHPTQAEVNRLIKKHLAKYTISDDLRDRLREALGKSPKTTHGEVVLMLNALKREVQALKPASRKVTAEALDNIIGDLQMRVKIRQRVWYG